MNSLPELSVIVPTLHEASILPSLIEGFARQREVTLEIILSDGGSRDGSIEIAERAAGVIGAPVVIVTGEPGRGGQLNRGAARSRGEFLLFMHADCFFPEPYALRHAVDFLRHEGNARGRDTAGKFRLGFERSGAGHPFGYYYYESKARLLRRECSHGDQGLLMPRRLFERVGPYDDRLPMLAETRMADALVDEGLLCLLPVDIRTSARRFEMEGLRERQTLNAIIMNFAALDWQPFFEGLPQVYPRQDQAGPLPLRQILRRIGRLIKTLPVRERLALWHDTGAYVKSNAWQLAFAADCLRNYRREIAQGAGNFQLLYLHDHHLDALTRNRATTILAALLVRIWFFMNTFR